MAEALQTEPEPDVISSKERLTSEAVPEGTLNDRLYEKPSEKDLLKVAKKVGGNWRYLLIGLDIQHGTIEQLWQKSLANPQQACFYGLVEWRSGGTQGHNQATWSTLLSALKNEAENGELARELEQELLCTQRVVQSTDTSSATFKVQPEWRKFFDAHKKKQASIPLNAALVRKYPHLMAKLEDAIDRSNPKVIKRIRTAIRQLYRVLIDGVIQAPVPQVGDTPCEVFEFLSKRSTPYEVFLLQAAMDELSSEKKMKKEFEEYKSELATFFKEKLREFADKVQPLMQGEDLSQMAIEIATNPNELTLSRVFKLQEFFCEYLKLSPVLFEGLLKGCTILFFAIPRESSLLIKDCIVLHISQLKTLGVTKIIVFDCFAADLEAATTSGLNTKQILFPLGPIASEISVVNSEESKKQPPKPEPTKTTTKGLQDTSKVRNKMEMQLEKEFIGLVIGKKGRTLQKIEQETGASISIKDYNDKGVAWLFGSKEQCDHAKGKIEEIIKSGHTRRPGEVHTKLISFVTSLDGDDFVKFCEYKEATPLPWRRFKNPEIYYLQAEQKDMTDISTHVSVEHMRNYSKLENAVERKLSKLLEKALPTKLEIRFGKILWLSDSKNTLSDEILLNKHQIRDLESQGSVSVGNVMGMTNWVFDARLLNPAVSQCLHSFTSVGKAEIIDITFTHILHKTAKNVRVRIQCTRKLDGSQPVYDLLEVGSQFTKDMVYDCLHLEGQLDMRVELSHCDVPADEKGKKQHDWTHEVHKSFTFDHENDVISFHGYPPDYKPDYIRHVHRKMYLVPYQGTEVILAHFDVSDCKCGSSSGPFKLECSHEELELWHVQWTGDFALLEGKDWREIFANSCCDVSKLKVQPKKIEVPTFLKELRGFMNLAITLSDSFTPVSV